MHVDGGILRFDIAEHLFVPFDFELGVQSTLQQNLFAAQLHRFADLLQQFGARQYVPFIAFGATVERTEIADCGADVRVVDISVDVVGAIAFGMQTICHRICRRA